MRTFLLIVDFGSTFSKFTLINKEAGEIIAQTSHPTTQKSSIMTGYKKGKHDVLLSAGYDDKVDQLEEYFCSSAWGGFKMIVIGFTNTLTQKAAEAAALGSGTRIVGSYFYELTATDLAEINQQHPDAVLLTGGTDGGNTHFVTTVAKQLASQLTTDIAVIYAGNQQARPAIEAIFDSWSGNLYFADNVMPAVNTIAVDDVRQVARDIFMAKILASNGLDQVANYARLPIIPTPTAVLLVTELWGSHQQTSHHDGTLVVDIGGATTDIHTFGKGLPRGINVFYQGVQEPQLKRTVEGDIGMRESADSVASLIGEETLQTTLASYFTPHDLQLAIAKRTKDAAYIADNVADMALDDTLAQYAMNTAIHRHVGQIKKFDSETWHQWGKDAREFQSVIATGGILIHSPHTKQLLTATFNQERSSDLRPKHPQVYLDNDYVLSALGVLSQAYPKLAYQLLCRHLVPMF